MVGSYIEQHYKQVNVWIPSRDTGVDLMVSDLRGRFTVSIQVKFGKDFLPTHMASEFQEPLRVCSWFALNRSKLDASQAHFWVFVMSGFKRRSPDFVTVPTEDLRQRLRRIHGAKGRIIQCYLWVTERNRCWEARGLEGGTDDRRRIAAGVYKNRFRDFTQWLNGPGWKRLVESVDR